MIEINNLELDLKDHKVITDYPLVFNDGSITFIKGKSGCGKTTLLYLVGLISMRHRCEYIYNGQLINNKKMQDKVRRNNIGFVFQNFNINEKLTIYENLKLFSQLNDNLFSKEMGISLLTKVGLDKDIFSYPDKLSGGEKQRLTIACVLAKNPNVIIADEPTSALDYENGLNVMGIFEQLAKEGKTIIIATHTNEYDNYADDIYEIKDGKICCDDKRTLKKNHVNFELKKLPFSFFRDILITRLKSRPKQFWIITILSMLLITMSVYFVQLGINLEQSYKQEVSKVIKNEMYLNFYGGYETDIFNESDIEKIKQFKEVKNIYPIYYIDNAKIKLQSGEVIENVEVYPIYDFQQTSHDSSLVSVDFSMYKFLNQELTLITDDYSKTYTVNETLGTNKTNLYSVTNNKKVFIPIDDFEKFNYSTSVNYIIEMNDFMDYEKLSKKIDNLQKNYFSKSGFQYINQMTTNLEQNKLYIYSSFIVLNIISLILLALLNFNDIINKRHELCIYQANGLTRSDVFILEMLELIIKFMICIIITISLLTIFAYVGNIFLPNDILITLKKRNILLQLSLLCIDYALPIVVITFYVLRLSLEEELRKINLF